MAISSFPPADSGASVTNDFILDKNNTTNNQFEMGRAFAAGGYSIAVTGSTAYDIYLLNATGSAVGYTNGTTVVATEAFESISALGLGTADSVSFTYNGPSTTADASGTEPGAGAYLTSITPSDLPQIDDTAIVAGGNFASGVQVTFTSGTVELAAKNVVVGSSTALVVTRPDGLIEDNAPYDLVAINPGVTPPTASGANILTGTVTAGTDPSFVTTSPILGAFSGTAFSTAILTSDSEGTVVNWEVTAGTVPTGLTLATATGAISGTPTVDGDFYFTVQITDDGGNTNSQEFNLPVGLQVSGGASTAVGGTTYVYFTASDDLAAKNASTMEYLVIAGGGAGGGAQFNFVAGGGGGAGGLLNGTAAPPSGTVTVTVGAGAPITGSSSNGANGTDSILAGFATATGGGGGGKSQTNAAGGGSGGGGGSQGGSPGGAGGTGVAGQGFAGGSGVPDNAGGGGGASEAGTAPDAGDGLQFGAWASAIGIVYDAGYFAGGGGGGYNGGLSGGGLGGGGNGGNTTPTNGSANSGGGGGGGPEVSGGGNGGAGGSGLVVVRFT